MADKGGDITITDEEIYGWFGTISTSWENIYA
jgi:hypothetical protein